MIVQQLLYFCQKHHPIVSGQKSLYMKLLMSHGKIMTQISIRIWIYRRSNSDISAQLLSGIIEGFGQYESALSVISEIVDSYYEKYDEPSEEIERLEQIYEEYNDSFKIMMQELEKLFEDIDQLAHYDYDYEVNSIINNDYGLESFDENLEYYVGLAIGEASADYESLIEDAEPTVKSIWISLMT